MWSLHSHLRPPTICKSDLLIYKRIGNSSNISIFTIYQVNNECCYLNKLQPTRVIWWGTQLTWPIRIWGVFVFCFLIKHGKIAYYALVHDKHRKVNWYLLFSSNNPTSMDPTLWIVEGVLKLCNFLRLHMNLLFNAIIFFRFFCFVFVDLLFWNFWSYVTYMK